MLTVAHVPFAWLETDYRNQDDVKLKEATDLFNERFLYGSYVRLPTNHLDYAFLPFKECVDFTSFQGRKSFSYNGENGALDEQKILLVFGRAMRWCYLELSCTKEAFQLWKPVVLLNSTI